MLDDRGLPIHAHGGGLLVPGQAGGLHDKWWWYGESAKNASGAQINAYSSPDLFVWTFEGVVFDGQRDVAGPIKRHGLPKPQPQQRKMSKETRAVKQVSEQATRRNTRLWVFSSFLLFFFFWGEGVFVRHASAKKSNTHTRCAFPTGTAPPRTCAHRIPPQAIRAGARGAAPPDSSSADAELDDLGCPDLEALAADLAGDPANEQPAAVDSARPRLVVERPKVGRARDASLKLVSRAELQHSPLHRSSCLSLSCVP
jgi:hypothetical protein